MGGGVVRWIQSSAPSQTWRMLSTGWWRPPMWSMVRAQNTACSCSSRNGHLSTAKSRSGRYFNYNNDSSWWCHCWFYTHIVMFRPQAKLAEGLNLAKEFHSNVQELLLKMCKCEESIGLLPAPSFVLDTVCSQLQDHRVGLVFNLNSYFFCPKIFIG